MAAATPTTSYWLTEPRPPWPAVRARRAARADVVVVGAGVTGCSCALTLAGAGLRVRLVEAREVAAGASGRNGGFALRGAALPYDRAREALGPDRARRLWRLSERALDRLAALGGDACRRVGSLRLATGPGEAAALERELEALRGDGFDAERFDLGSSALAPLYDAAILHPRDAAIHPARWVRRLAGLAVAAGAELVEAAPVSAGALVELDADAVVVAADALSAELAPELAGVVVPRRGQMLVTEPLDELLFPRPHYARDGFDYWQQLPDRRLVVGGKRDASFETEATAEDATTALVQARLEELVVELAGRLPRITHRWSGSWGETPDLLPLAGRLPGRESVWVAAGYSGHGNVLGLACGDLVARAILGGPAPELELFAPGRLLGS